MDPHEKTARRPGHGFLLVFIVLAAGIVASGFFFYGNYKKHFRAEIERQLSVVAELKVSELEDWRAERLADAALFFKNASFSGLVRQFLEKPKDSAGRDQLRIWLSRFQAAHEYDRIFLLDVHGVERMAVPDTPEPVGAHLLEQAPEILRSGRVTFVDFHRDAPDGPIHLSVLVPVLDDREDMRAAGILVLMIDPEKYLYPYINRWPTPSRTAETLIVRRDGNDALFLNELRFQKNTVLNLRSPLGNTDMPAVKAVLGQEGFVEGVDYRGVPVLAALRAVPGSPWFLVARMDVAEAFAPLREREWVMIVLVGSLLLGAGGATGFVWRHQRAHFYRERYEAAEALRAVSLRKEALLSAVLDIIVEVDSNKVYTWANRAGLEFFGEDVIGKEAAFYFEGEQDTYQIVKPMFNGHEAVIYVESWQRRRDGEKRLLAWWCRVLKDDNGRVTGALSSARDITESKRYEEELQAKNDELTRFAYTVSHDLKSPLVTIRTFLGYLEQDIRKPDAAIVDKDLTYIRNAADKASRLLDELLELSRIGRKVNPPVEVPLQEVVNEALELAAGRIAERGVTVKVTKDPIQLTGDRPRLVEVFLNLVDNAVKYMGDEPAPCVEIGVDEVGGETVLFVRDNGIGIDPQYQPKLFGLFEKLDPGTEGTGIGLALVKRIVDVHGGRIWVESEGPGKGATFRFTLAKTKRKPA
ncbi:MAG: ATP-binding protein [Candidatus Aminicenantes bacterium]|nr:ATP-binding protein [Candidatus Aminicenantes bacterium]